MSWRVDGRRIGPKWGLLLLVLYKKRSAIRTRKRQQPCGIQGGMYKHLSSSPYWLFGAKRHGRRGVLLFLLLIPCIIRNPRESGRAGFHLSSMAAAAEEAFSYYRPWRQLVPHQERQKRRGSSVCSLRGRVPIPRSAAASRPPRRPRPQPRPAAGKRPHHHPPRPVRCE